MIKCASEVTGIFNILDIKQFFSASFVTAENSSAVIPGTAPVIDKWTVVIFKPSNVTAALVSNDFGGNPFLVKMAATDIVKQPACAAPSNSSGFVPFSPSSNLVLKL